MTRWLSSLLAALRGDPPDAPLCEQLRRLWRVPHDWQHRTTARVVRKPRIVKSSNERKAS